MVKWSGKINLNLYESGGVKNSKLLDYTSYNYCGLLNNSNQNKIHDEFDK